MLVMNAGYLAAPAPGLRSFAGALTLSFVVFHLMSFMLQCGFILWRLVPDFVRFSPAVCRFSLLVIFGTTFVCFCVACHGPG